MTLRWSSRRRTSKTRPKMTNPTDNTAPPSKLPDEEQREFERLEERNEAARVVETLYGPTEAPAEEVSSEKVEPSPPPPPVARATPEQPETAVADGLTSAEVRQRDALIADSLKLKAAKDERDRRLASLSDLEKRDPSSAARLRAEIQEFDRGISAAEARGNAAVGAFNAKLVDRHRTTLHRSERNKMLAQVPQLLNASVVKEFNDHLIAKYGKDAIERTLDHRFFVAEYHAMVAAKPQQPKKKFRVPTVKPRVSPSPAPKKTVRSPGMQRADAFYGQSPPRQTSVSASRRSGEPDAIEILYGK